MQAVEGLVDELGLNTVCREASCPNYCECFGRGTATFMILGAVCTRSCGFCGVSGGAPSPVDRGEPVRVAEAVRRLDLNYVVVTSVTRDDLADGGAAHFAEVVREIRRLSPGTKIETLIPDLGGSEAALDLVIDAAPDVISHNMETVRELYAKVRPQADYERSLELLRRVAERGGDGEQHGALDIGACRPDSSSTVCPCSTLGDKDKYDDRKSGWFRNANLGRTIGSDPQDTDLRAASCPPTPTPKSGLMVGVGETDAQVRELMFDLRNVGCSILTIGQYLRPSKENIPVEAYIEPAVFDRWAAEARAMGFEFVASAPFVRSSYHAEEALARPAKEAVNDFA